MDSAAFDRLTTTFATSGTRRGVTRLLLGVPLLSRLVGLRGEAPAVAATDDDHGSSHRRHRRKAKHRHQTGNDKENRKGKRKRRDKGAVGAQDCQDGTIGCYILANVCGDRVGGFGPVGHCWQGWPELACCPCEHPDSGYWTNLCNTTVPACNGNGCLAQDEVSFSCFECQPD